MFDSMFNFLLPNMVDWSEHPNVKFIWMENWIFIRHSPVLGGLDGTGLESFDSAVTDSMNDGRFVGGILLGIMTNSQLWNEKINKLIN